MSSPLNHIGKSSIEDYDSYSRFRDYGNLKIKSRIRKIYDAHSSALLIGVDGREIQYEIFRTKT